jgi:nitroreductase
MEAWKLLRSRQSVRQYLSRPIKREVLEKALEAARHAPTARNLQPWEFVVVQDKARLQRLAAVTDNGKFIAHAAACILCLCCDTKYYLEDGAAAVTYCLLALQAQGVGACWVAGDKKAYAADILREIGAPPEMRLIALVACGYSRASVLPQKKRPLADMVHWEGY